MDKWPYRGATLIRRFERAVRVHAALTANDDAAMVLQATQMLEIARRDLLARIRPATEYQARRRI